MSDAGLLPPDERPVEAHEWLLRRVAADAALFILPDGPPTFRAFTPSERDTTGLSVNREGADYITDPDQVLASAGDRVREYGGVVAVNAGLVFGLGLTVDPDPVPASPGHCVIPEFKHGLYSGAGKTRIKELAAGLARAAQIRKAPRSPPARDPSRAPE